MIRYCYFLSLLVFGTLLQGSQSHEDLPWNNKGRRRSLTSSSNIILGCDVEDPSEESLRKELSTLHSKPAFSYRGASRFGFLERLRRRFRWLACRFFLQSALCTFPDVVINVVMHDISKENGTKEEGSAALSDAEITVMMDHANAVFEGTGFSFRLQNLTRTVNSTWFDAVRDSPEEIEMMTALKVGGVETINVYLKDTLNEEGELRCGYGIYASSGSRSGVQDAITVTKICTGPGDGLRNGDTFPHEIGHWLDLYHPHSGGCDPGDLVDDTPPQRVRYERTDDPECPDPFPDTCPWREGRDPVDNIMSSSADFCRKGFTKGQTQRMHEGWERYREP